MNEPKTYVRIDEHGARRVGQSDISLDSVIIAFQDGLTPEAICLEYPALSLEEVYGAISYYLANREEVDEYLTQQQRLWARERLEADRHPSPTMERLKAARSTGAAPQPAPAPQDTWEELLQQIEATDPKFPTAEEAVGRSRKRPGYWLP